MLSAHNTMIGGTLLLSLVFRKQAIHGMLRDSLHTYARTQHVLCILYYSCYVRMYEEHKHSATRR